MCISCICPCHMSALLFVAQQIHFFTFLMYEVFQSVRYHPVTHILLPSTPYLRLFNLIKGYCRGGPYRNFLFEENICTPYVCWRLFYETHDTSALLSYLHGLATTLYTNILTMPLKKCIVNGEERLDLWRPSQKRRKKEARPFRLCLDTLIFILVYIYGSYSL